MAAAAVPGAVVFAERSPGVRLVWAGAAVPVALLLGVFALTLGSRGLRNAERTLVGRTGGRTARVGWFLGLLGILVAGTGAISLAVYAYLVWRGR